MNSMRPVTLCFSGLDPSGGAGLQADIEAIAGLGGHAAVVCTALTVQDSQSVYDFSLVDTKLLIAQAEAVLADLNVVSVKIGMLGSRAVVEAIFALLTKHPHIGRRAATNSGDHAEYIGATPPRCLRR